MATDKKYSISIGNLKDTIKDVESFGDALEKSGGKLDELGKLTKKIEEYDREYQKSLQQSKNTLKEKNDTIKEEIDLEKANQTIQENSRKSYKEKQKLMNALAKEIKSMSTETDEQKKKQQELINQYSELNQELKDFDKEMGNSQRSVGEHENATKSLKQQLRGLEEEIANMLANGVSKLDPALVKLVDKAGAIKDAIKDAKEEINRSASDTKALDDIINVAQSATAAFTLFKGAMSAFGIETEGAMEAIQKLQGAMAIIQSLQQLQDTLNQNTLTTRLFTKVINLMSVALGKGSTASKILRGALLAIPLMLIITLVTELILHWDELVGWFTKTFPVLKNLSTWFDKVRGTVSGLGNAVWAAIKSFGSIGEMVKALFSGQWGKMVEIAKQNFARITQAYQKGYADKLVEIEEDKNNKVRQKQLEENEYQLQMMQAKLGADAKYSKAGIALQKKILEDRKKLAKGNKDELKKIALDEANFYRECQEKKTAAAKKSADDRKKAEKEAAAEAKRLAAEQKKKEEEAKKKAEEEQKKELERIKNLNDARKEGAELEIEYQKAVLNEKLRVVNESVAAQEKEEKQLNSQIDKLKQIANNENLSKKTRKQASEQLERATAKLMRVEEDRKNLLDKEAELEKEIVRLNQQKSENDVYDQLKEHLGNIKLTKEELQSMMNMSDEALKETYKFDDAQVQHVKNAILQIKTIKQTAETAIAAVTTKAEKKKSEDSGSSGGSSGDDKDDTTPWEKAGWAEKLKMIVDTAVLPAMDTISMFMDFAIEQTQQELDQITELHDKAMDKVNDSAEKIAELNEKLKDSSADNRAALEGQLADEQLLYAQRLAEEKKLAEEEKKTKNKLAQQEAKARKVELATQLVMGISNTALGITQALKAYPPPLSFVMAGLVGAMGAVQTALIAAQIAKVKPVKYADGGILSGPSHSRGGIPVGNTNIEVEGGEMVVNKRDTARYSDVLHKINKNDPSVRYLQGNSKKEYADTKIRKFANGGQLNFQRADETLRTQQETSRLIGAINGINMQPIVSVKDIWKAEDRLVKVRGLAGR